MKKGFTLIELLVVIAIIAILAAILFPVFAQAKAAAKKTVAISNQKQIGLSVLMYMADYDDRYPRNDDCSPNSSLNPALNSRPFNPTGQGCVSAPFHYRMNHYAWQKWVMPYVKNLQLFEHPGRQKIDAITSSCPGGQWSDCGQIMGGFALNLAITGALNTYNRAPTAGGRERNSWLGGSQNNIPDVSRAMILLEYGHPSVNFAPVVFDSAISSNPVQTVYPAAFREFWGRWLLQWNVCTGANMNEMGSQPNALAFAGGVALGMADGSAKFFPVQKFLAETPTAAEYGVALPASNACGGTSGVIVTSGTPNVRINYPLWGLTNQ